MNEEPLLPGRGYWLKLATQTVSATIAAPKYALAVDTGEHLAAKTLELNDIGVAEITTDRPLVFEPYADSRALGGFILVDKITNATVAAGMLHFALRRAHNIHWQALDVSREAHARLKGQKPADPVVHRPVRRGQVDHRQSGREEAPRDKAATPSCSTATMSATGSTRIWASPTPTGSRMSAAWAKWRG